MFDPPAQAPWHTRGTTRQYLVAVGLSVAFLGLRGLLEPILHGQAPLIALLGAPIFACWYCGFGPAMVATLLCAIGGELFFIPPIGLFAPADAAEWVRLAIFVLYGLLFSWLIETRRRAFRRMQADQQRLVVARDDLAQREARLHAVLEAAPAGMLVVSPTGRIELVNGEAERLFGHPRERLLGMTEDQLVLPEHRAGLASYRTRFQAAPSTQSMNAGAELFALRADGSTLPVEVGLNPLQGTDEGRVLVSVTDVSARRQAEQALRDSREQALRMADDARTERARLDVLLDAAPAGIIVAAADGTLLRQNPAHHRIWGRPPEESAGVAAWYGWWADKSPRHGQPVQAHEWALARALRGEVVTDDVVEIEPFGSPGVRRTLFISAAPVRDADGRVTGGVMTQADVTGLAAAQKALRESEALFRSLADNIAQLAWMTDAQGQVFWFNRRWYDYTGATERDLHDWGWRRFHHPDHHDRVMERYRQHLRTGEPWEDTFPVRGRDGHYRWFLSRAFPIHDDDGHVAGWFGTNTDIQAQREAEEALREADRRKDEFIAVLAHELRNPLAPVRNAVEILRRSALPDARLHRAGEIIARQVGHMARLIDDLLDVSRIARGKLSLQKERCDLSAIVRQTAEDYRQSLQAAGQELRIVDAAPGPVWVDGDPVRLAQMLGNLLSNASRFHHQPGHVEVSTGADPDTGMASITVVDTGIGMDEDLLSRLFDPFEQAAQDMARSKGGLGLGLALTKGLAELHGGLVEAHSLGVGHGSTFRLLIPLLPPRGSPTAMDTTTPATDTAPRRCSILIVEDNPDAASTLAELLQLDGHAVDVAHDGAAGVEAARRLHPQVVISDLGLPGEVNGYELAKRLRAQPELAGVKLVALSGYADEQARRRSMEAGFDAHLAKPPEIDDLLRIVGDAMNGAPA